MSCNYFELNTMSIILVLLLIIYTKQINHHGKSSSMLCRVMAFIAISMLSDLVYYYVDGRSFAGAELANYIFLILYFVGTTLAAYYWFCYVYYELYNCFEVNRVKKIIIRIPMIVLILMVVASPVTKWIFYIKEGNIYSRGDLYICQLVLSYIYIIAGMVFAFRQYKKEIVKENKHHCLYLCFYTVLPLIGGIVQALNFGVDTALPTIVVSIVMIYLDNITQQLLLDPLTLLNNRGQFDRYIAEKVKTAARDNTNLIFLDIDNFKKINDEFGHIDGDKALKLVSTQLQVVFKDAFIARYGGDEFAVIVNGSDSDIKHLMAEFNLRVANISEFLEFGLSLSAGYSNYGKDKINSVKEWIHTADKKMYNNKIMAKSLK